MTFGQPLWLWAFALLPLLLLLFIRQERQRTGLLRRLVAARLAPRLAGSVSPGKRRLAFAFLLVGTAGVLAALAQPRWGFTWDERKGRGRDVLIAIDVSRSMLANDLTPNRLTRVKLAAEDLIGQLPGDRVGIIAFAGSAFLQAPLTADHSAVLTSLRELDVNVIPRGGTNIADAIRVAKEAVGVGEGLHRALVLFTDGEELGADGVEAAKGASGIMRMFTVGAGSPEGTVIALPNAAGSSGYLKDPEGRIVKSKLDDVRLRAIAEATGGFYLRLQQGAPEMRQLAEEGLGKMSDQEIDTTISKQPIERYQWPLAAGTLLLASSLLVGERRRRPLAAATAGVLVLFAPLAHGRNSAAEAWDRKDYAASLESFSKQAERRPEVLALEYGRGTAAYKAGRYDEAVEAFGRALCSPDTRLRTKAEYNLGNTLYQQGAGEKEPEGKMQWWRDAVKRYDQALEFEPKHADAAHNREIVRKLLEELEKKQAERKEKEKEKKKEDSGKKDGKEDKKDGKEKGKPEPGKEGKPEKGKGDTPDQKPGVGEQENPDPSEKGDPRDSESPGEEGEPAEPKNGKGDPAKDQPPKPAPEGELKDKPQSGTAANKNTEAEQQAAEDAAAAAEGRMTERQAVQLLESLRPDDAKVRLWGVPRDRRKDASIRDW